MFSQRVYLQAHSFGERNWMQVTEILMVLMALEERRHWLEVSEDSFLVGIDHKNLEYVCTAERLNSRQERWSLFF